MRRYIDNKSKPIKERFNTLLKYYNESFALQGYMQDLLDALSDAIFIVGAYSSEDFLIKIVNRATYEMFGYSEEEIIGMDIEEIVKEGIAELSLLYEFNQDKILNMEKTFIKKDGSEVPILFSVSKLENIYEGTIEYIIIAQDLTFQKETESQLREYASKDQMTGVFNRATGISKLESLISSIEYTNTSLIICFIDINNLKVVNDTLGHAIGDELIVGVTDILKENVNDEDYIMRLGGDEFVIVFVDRTMDYVKNTMISIEDKLNGINQNEFREYELSISYGLADYDKKERHTVDHFIEIADQRMYNMKKDKKEKIKAYRHSDRI